MISRKLLGITLLIAVIAYGGNFLYKELESASMSYATWKTANSALNLSGKNVLVVGGTQGIGAGVAIRFSQLGSSVVIAGRNETLAKNVISQMESNHKSDSQEFKFLKVDATMIEDLERFTKEAQEYFESKGGVDYIVQTQGVLNFGLSLTTEGHDKAFMINSYSKWFITNQLLPLLKESNVYICNPAKGGSINFEDVELKNSTRYPGGPGNRDGVYLDSMTREFQERNPTKRFYHVFPGFVESDIAKNSNMNPVLRFFMEPLKYFARSQIDFADLPVYLATQDKNGGVSMNQNAKLYPYYDWIKNGDNRAKLWKWNEDFSKNGN